MAYMVRTCDPTGSSPSRGLGPERQTQAKRTRKTLLEEPDQRTD